MCSPKSPFAPKNRRQRVIANLSLVIALLLSNFAHPSSQFHRNWLHLLCGMLLGISVALSICVLRSARRLRT